MHSARLLAVLTLSGAFGLAGATRAPAQDATAAALRRLYFQQDYAGALMLGRGVAEGRDAPPEAIAWLVASMAADDRPDSARATAEALARRHPDDSWSSFARAIARVPKYGFAAEDAPQLAARARAAGPLDPDLTWLVATVHYRTRAYARAIAVLDSLAGQRIGSAELLVLRGEVETARAFDPPRDSTAVRRARGAFDAALSLDSACVGAWVGLARLLEEKGAPGAYEALQRARAAAPLSAGVRVALWKAMLARGDLPGDSARRMILADLDALARARPGLAATLALQVGTLRAFGQAARADSAESELGARYAGSYEAEEVALGRLQQQALVLSRQPPADSVTARQELRRRLQEFVAAPGRRPAHLGSAYGLLYELARRDTSIAGQELERVAQGVASYTLPDPRTRLSSVVLLLIERAGDPALAERLARDIPRHYLAENRTMLLANPDTTPVARFRLQHLAAAEGEAAMHDALGWLRLRQGRLSDADQELTRARKGVPLTPVLLFHAARLAERQERLEDAQKLYIQAALLPDAPDEPRIEQSLRALYARRNGSAAGYDTLLAAARAARREAIRANLLGRRIQDPKPLASFRLTRLEGGTFSSDELKGKIAVVNFWGLWCAPCVEEIPQIERLYRRYSADPSVVVVTIDHDTDPQKVRDFVAQRKLPFPVLLDGGYSRGRVNGWPTTWFVDREGRIAYRVEGATVGMVNDDDIVQQMVWRVESLRDTAAAKARKP